MKRILLLSALCLATTLFGDDAPATPQAAPTTVATPAAPAKKDVRPPKEKCFVSVSQGTFDADKTCTALDVTQCGKQVSTCQWKSKELKCRGYLLQMCVSNVRHNCDGGIEAVTKFPEKKEPHTFRFKCFEKTPLSVKKA